MAAWNFAFSFFSNARLYDKLLKILMPSQNVLVWKQGSLAFGLWKWCLLLVINVVYKWTFPPLCQMNVSTPLSAPSVGASAAARLLQLRVRIPPRAGISVSCVCCRVEVSASGWSLVQRSPTECGVSDRARKASIMRRPWPTKGYNGMGRKTVEFVWTFSWLLAMNCLNGSVHWHGPGLIF
jgi:hypothetical protein